MKSSMAKFVRTHKGLRRRWTLDLIVDRKRVATRLTGEPVFDKWYTYKRRDLMAKVSSSRTFNNRVYLIDEVYGFKENAQFYAEAHRFEGRKARVIPSSHGYIVYVGVEQ